MSIVAKKVRAVKHARNATMSLSFIPSFSGLTQLLIKQDKINNHAMEQHIIYNKLIRENTIYK